MQKIQLTQDKFAIVDDEDFVVLNSFRWFAVRNEHCNDYRAARRDLINGLPRTVYMHRQIMGADIGLVVDHVNHNGLDNRKSNLRVCTTKENLRNRVARRNNGTGYKGVSKYRNKFRAFIGKDGKDYHLGYFNKPEDAAKAYNMAAIKKFGKFSLINTM